jgi:F0F1-type ATP synthase assembly protein I
MPDNFERTLQPTDKLTFAARIVTAIVTAVLLVELVVWLLISIIGGDLASPWWLWTVLVGGVVAGTLQLLAHRGKKARS